MGYLIEMTDSKFEIKKENFDKALKNLKSIFVPENMRCYDYIGGKAYPHFSWVDTKIVLESETLEDALKEIRYVPEYNSNGDICNVEFTGEKYGDEEIFFNALAPYIVTGSYITFEGEDGFTWEWSFKNGKVTKIDVETIWKKEYWDNDGELYRDLDREDDGTPIDEIGRYEIVFDFDGQRYYCFVDAINMDEALGNFFRNHNTVKYSDIVEHMEI